MARQNSQGTILPYGHSNVRSWETEPDPDSDARDTPFARIPLLAEGRTGHSQKVPPLALSQQEWETIGKKMGWLSGGAMNRSE